MSFEAPALSNTYGGAIEAPTISSLANNPGEISARTTPVYIRGESSGEMTAVPEGAAIVDFYDKLTAAQKMMLKHDDPQFDPVIQLASDLQEIYFIGADEFSNGAQAIAQRWFERLVTGTGDSFYVGIEPGSSSAFAFGHVIEKFKEIDPDALDFVIPFDMGKGRIFTEANCRPLKEKGGVTLVDDWIISGRQLAESVSRLTMHSQLETDDIEIDVIYAGKPHLERFKDGIDVWSTYTGRNSRFGVDVKGSTSVAGVHHSPDFGGSRSIFLLYLNLPDNDSVTPLAWPLIDKAHPAYRSADREFIGSDEHRAILDEQRRLCAEVAGKTVVFGMTHPSEL